MVYCRAGGDPVLRKKGKNWFKLDNAGKLYPAVSSFRWSSVFRLAADLADTVDPVLLQKAVDRAAGRFPSMKVRMRAGLFWYYLEEIQEPLTVRPDAGQPCMPFRFRQDQGYLMRVFYDRNRIAVEFFHSLTDGCGAMTYLKTLVVEYLRLCGVDAAFDNGALDVNEPPSQEETQDAFLHMPLPGVRVSRKESTAYHFPATREIPHTLNIIAATMPGAEIAKRAKALGVTITEYLTSVILWTAYLDQEARKPRKKLPVRVSVPVNMRAFYPSRTLRNFSSFVNPGIDPRLGEYTFEEIARHVHAYMKYAVNLKMLSAVIATNVDDEKNMLVRLVPRFIKNWVIGGIFRRAGDRLVTATLTNLGIAKKPTGTENHIRRFMAMLGPPYAPLCNCGVISTGNELLLIFSSNIHERTLPREMLRFLVEQGVPVTVESNLEDD